MPDIDTNKIDDVRQAEERPMAQRTLGKSLLLAAALLTLATVIAIAVF